MHELHELKEKLMDELSEYAQHGKFTKEDVETIKYMASAIDHICNIVERADDEYSQRGGSYNYGMRGGSYARGGRGGRRGGANQYGSYAMEGYSRSGPEELAESIRGMMQNLPPEAQRDAGKLVQKLEQM